MKNKILLVNLGGYGDILNCTPIAKHHKIVDPGCEVIWLTRKKYFPALKNNTYIDKVIFVDEEDLNNFFLSEKYYYFFKGKNIDAKFVAPYSALFKRDVKYPARSSLLQIIKYETSGVDEFACEFIPNVILTDEEKKEAKSFFSTLKGNKKILFEYENFSEQTPFNEEYFETLCKSVNNKNYDLVFTGVSEPEYLTEEVRKKYSINFHHYKGSFMSNAELYNLCDVFLGTSSGITCLTHADYCNTNKLRIEVSYGFHWSTVDWKHMNNKHIVFYKKQFIDALKEL